MYKILKGAMFTFLSLTAFVIVALVAMSAISHSGGSHGLFKGKLQACKMTSNCVCTEDHGNRNADPLEINNVATIDAWRILKNAVIETGGTIEQDEGDYLWATYTTPVFRFMDDFEARLDKDQSVIHFRSASRVGHGDMGVNRKRLDAIIEKYRSVELNTETQ